MSECDRTNMSQLLAHADFAVALPHFKHLKSLSIRLYCHYIVINDKTDSKITTDRYETIAHRISSTLDVNSSVAS